MKPKKPSVSLVQPVAVDGSVISLVCDTASNLTSVTVLYKWRRGSLEIATVANKEYSFTAEMALAGDYSCTVIHKGTESLISEQFRLRGKKYYQIYYQSKYIAASRLKLN